MGMNPNAEFLQGDDCLLLLVDIQKVMLDPCDESARLIKNTDALMEVAKVFNLPMVFSVHNAEKLGGFHPDLLRKVDGPLVLNKVEFSCLENEDMAKAILESGRKTLLVAGLETHVCIFHTCCHAVRLGFRVHVAADAVASRSRLNWEIGLKRMERAGVVVSSTEMIIYELLNRAGTPEFRALLPRLKTL
jgi:nicotinamidase-related amidase